MKDLGSNPQRSGHASRKKSPGNRFDKKKCMIVIGIAVAALIAVYLIVSFVFQSRFLPGTVINGAECGGKTVEEAQEFLKQETENYVLTLKEREDKEETIEGADIRLEINFGNELEELKAGQSGFGWIGALIHGENLEVEKMITYDEVLFDKAVKNLACMDEGKMVDSVNASLSEYQAGKGYELEDAVFGTRVDTEKLQKLIEDSVVNLQAELDLAESECYIDPEYTEESDEAKAMLESANKYVNTTITYEFGNEKETLDGALISQWITVGDDLVVTLDAAKVDEYVSALADKYNTAGKSKSLNTSYGRTVTVPGGNYGWKIDKTATRDALSGYLESGEDYTGEVVYSQTAASHGDNDFGNTYVEINLTGQHLWFYKNGSLIVESDFVSGDVSKGRNTPTGAYRIAYKQKDRILRGEDYASPVSFWMPFNGAIGLHDASWRSNFGGAIYLRNGSHGCINLPYSVAKTIYNNISAGDAVLVYTLSGTESKATAAAKEADPVIEVIEKIGTVTLESGGAIADARGKYDALSSTAKKYVTNYDTLASAEATYSALLQQQQQQQEEEQRRQQEEQQKAQAQQEAQGVINAINSIGAVTADSGGAISGARAQYDALSDLAKSYVTNYGTLTVAESEFAALQAQPPASGE